MMAMIPDQRYPQRKKKKKKKKKTCIVACFPD
jgi:hypothetical protein